MASEEERSPAKRGRKAAAAKPGEYRLALGRESPPWGCGPSDCSLAPSSLHSFSRGQASARRLLIPMLMSREFQIENTWNLPWISPLACCHLCFLETPLLWLFILATGRLHSAWAPATQASPLHLLIFRTKMAVGSFWFSLSLTQTLLPGKACGLAPEELSQPGRLAMAALSWQQSSCLNRVISYLPPLL